jgi:hypothetical protein
LADLLDGRVAGLLDGLEAFIDDDLDMEPLEARWPIRWASNSSGAKNSIKIAAKESFKIDEGNGYIR